MTHHDCVCYLVYLLESPSVPRYPVLPPFPCPLPSRARTFTELDGHIFVGGFALSLDTYATVGRQARRGSELSQRVEGRRKRRRTVGLGQEAGTAHRAVYYSHNTRGVCPPHPPSYPLPTTGYVRPHPLRRRRRVLPTHAQRMLCARACVRVCVCACARAYVRVRVCVCMCVCARVRGREVRTQTSRCKPREHGPHANRVPRSGSCER